MINLTVVTLLLALINYALFVENAMLLISGLVILLSFYLVTLLCNYANKPDSYITILMIVLFMLIMCKSINNNCDYTMKQNQYSYLHN